MGKVDDEVMDIIQDIEQSCRDAIDAAEELSVFEKMDSSVLEVEKTPVDIRAVVKVRKLNGLSYHKLFDICTVCKETLCQFSKQATMHDIVLRYSDTALSGNAVDFPQPLVPAARHRVSKVMRNLLSNAVKFTKKRGTVSVSVRHVAESTDKTRSSSTGWIRVEVVDEAVGISQEHQLSLFTGLGQNNPIERKEGGGSGLGLWVSKGIMDLLGGNIGVHSEGLGCGSTFFIELPLLPTEYNPSHDLKELRVRDYSSDGLELSQSEIFPSTPPVRVLIVDDSPMCRKMVRRIIRDECSFIDDASNGIEAVNKVQDSVEAQEPFDVILLDMHMPVMSGHIAVARIRKLGFTGIVLGLTGDASPADVTDFINAGTDRVMFKPIEIHLLQKYVTDIRANAANRMKAAGGRGPIVREVSSTGMN